MTVTTSNRSRTGPLSRAATDLAALVDRLCESFPPEDRDWLTDPLRHAARSAAEHVGLAWRDRRRPAAVAGWFARSEADLHEVQTWALLAMRHHHLSPRAADGVDRRCEAILDALSALSHPAVRHRSAA